VGADVDSSQTGTANKINQQNRPIWASMKTTKSFLRSTLYPSFLACSIASFPASAGLFSSPAEDAKELQERWICVQDDLRCLLKMQVATFY